ncbi:hypothetical protein OH77DRAFT_1429761 [Trametes cingulata]|nr:hypothetical protein OH77DRAFT_1429761 [Trametes cingulata]
MGAQRNARTELPSVPSFSFPTSFSGSQPPTHRRSAAEVPVEVGPPRQSLVKLCRAGCVNPSAILSDFAVLPHSISASGLRAECGELSSTSYELYSIRIVRSRSQRPISHGFEQLRCCVQMTMRLHSRKAEAGLWIRVCTTTPAHRFAATPHSAQLIDEKDYHAYMQGVHRLACRLVVKYGRADLSRSAIYALPSSY